MADAASGLDLQGHRGARGLLPENTLPAFARAIELGMSTLELDCAITRDGVVVVSHDTALNPDITRGPDGEWLAAEGPEIWHLTYDELKRYDVGRIRPDSAYALRFRQQQPVDGARIPKLAEVFALAQNAGHGTVRFNIETKISPLAPDRTPLPEDFARRLIAEIRTHGMASRATIQSFDWRALRVVQHEAPEIPTAYLTAQQGFMDNIRAKEAASPWTAGLHVSRFGGSIPRMVKVAGGAVWSPYYREVTHENLAEAHAFGLKVWVWTLNRESDIRRMIGLGVDGLISDYPDLLRKVAADTGVATAAARHEP